MTVEVYLHGSKESNYERGQEAGLKGEAGNIFCYAACEVALTLEVNEATGESRIIAVDGRAVAA